MGHKNTFTRILSLCFLQHWDSSTYKFSKFVHKIHYVSQISLAAITASAVKMWLFKHNNLQSTVSK